MERLEATRSLQLGDILFTQEAASVIDLARAYGGLNAEERTPETHAGTEHLLLALAQDQPVRDILTRTGIPVDSLITDLNTYVATDPNTPETDVQGHTETFNTAIRNAQLLATRDISSITTTHLYAGMIEAGWGMALISLGGKLGFPVDRQHESAIQDALFEYIPSMRRE